MAVFLILVARGTGEQVKRVGKNQREGPHQALIQVEDEPGLARVLLIGDSISIGYTVPVRELLRGKANVHRPLANCAATSNGIEKIDEWLGDKPWDVIHFNWGLHDLKYMGPNGENLVDPGSSDNHQNVPIDEYENNLRRLVARLKETGASLIWCSTTPVPEGAQGRVSGDSARYNEVAARIMTENGVAIDDLHAFAEPRLKEMQRRGNVHFTDQGYKDLAGHVVLSIEKALQHSVPSSSSLSGRR